MVLSKLVIFYRFSGGEIFRKIRDFIKFNKFYKFLIAMALKFHSQVALNPVNFNLRNKCFKSIK